jgi:hypothetical protein
LLPLREAVVLFESRFRAVAFRIGSAIAALADSKKDIVLFSLSIGGLMAGFEFAVHEVVIAAQLSELTHATVDAGVIGCGSALFTIAWLTALRGRRRKVREDIHKIGELNHEVRNALEVIVGSQYGADSDRARLVLQSVDRIDVTLRELFPLPPPRRNH